jgi:hypothetical protein
MWYVMLLCKYNITVLIQELRNVSTDHCIIANLETFLYIGVWDLDHLKKKLNNSATF